MITADTPVFPNNAVSVVAARMALIDEDIVVVQRPLRRTDPVQSIGVYGVQWLPNEGSYEMSGVPLGRHEPTIQRYLIAIQAMAKDADQERGLAVHSVLAKIVRAILYRDEPLRVGLSSLSVTMNESTEHTTRWGIQTQRYFNNELEGSWLYLSTLELWLETETI